MTKMAVIYNRATGRQVHVHPDTSAYERLMAHSRADCTCSPPVHDDGKMREFGQRLKASKAPAWLLSQPKVCTDCGLSHTQLMARSGHDPKVRERAARDLAKNFGGTVEDQYRAIEQALGGK